MVDLIQLYLLNLIITIVLTIGTFYRIKIEREHTKATILELRLQKRNKELYDILIREQKMLESCTAKDIKEFYNFLLKWLENTN